LAKVGLNYCPVKYDPKNRLFFGTISIHEPTAALGKMKVTQNTFQQKY
jgi:hypothetical protein